MHFLTLQKSKEDMRKNVALGTYNRATYLDQTQAIMKEKHVAKSFLRVRSHAPPERAWFCGVWQTKYIFTCSHCCCPAVLVAFQVHWNFSTFEKET